MLLIRERVPLRLSAVITRPDGLSYRWGQDEHDPGRAPGALSFSDTMPGGFEQCGLTLARNPAFDYPDVAEFSKLSIRGVGDLVAWEGRLETAPRVSGSQMAITPGAVGWQAALDDNKTARAIYLDVSNQSWQPPTAQRQIDLWGSGYAEQDASSAVDTSGVAVTTTEITAPWNRRTSAEGWYDARGLNLGVLYYSWETPILIGITPDYHLQALLSSDDRATATTSSGDLFHGATATSDVVSPGGRKWAIVQLYIDIDNGSAATSVPIQWRLAVIGDHGLTIRGTWDGTADCIGLKAADVVKHAVTTFAPELAVSRAGVSTISSSSSFLIPHLLFIDPAATSDMVKQASRFDLQDWAVWEGPTFYWNDYNARGRKWRTRVGPGQLQESGPQVDRIWNSVTVQYNDVTGVTRTVGPTGSASDTEDASLTDSDPENPATLAGLTRRAVVQMGVSTPSGALRVGQTFLQQQKLRSTAGQATLTGHVEDDRGVLWPAWAVRAGDQISFVDAHDPSYRRIVKKSYDDSTKTASVDLDSPPDALQELLERMSVSLTPLGFS